MKAIVFGFFKILISLAYAAYRIEGVNALLLIMPAKLIVPTLKRYGAKIGDDVIIHSPLIIHNAGENYSNLIIGSHVYFGRAVFLDLKDRITLADRVTLSMRAMILTHTDVGDSKVKAEIPPSQGPVTMEQDAYIGANVTVLQNVRVGAGSVTGAGAVVLHDVPAATVVAGNPAKEIKKLRA
jgi:acetyltransferase-like isoleucine patch superfamily enzyme